ncbi:MAG: CotH kinase family protein [Chitinispirillales bacterium]|jgi:hypothetical protein|nr:CotH kinase family protein [Chitinispirillales bacterium]
MMSTTVKKNPLRLAMMAAAVLALAAQSFAALPEIRITTANNANPDQGSGGGGMWGGTTSYKYVKISEFKLTDPNNGNNDVTRSSKPDSIRVRGNSTAGLDKKPYRIKFGEKIKLFGDTAAKSWVLLANYYDGTFALNAIAFELGKRLGVEFTNKYWFVDVYINNQYKGLYQLTEQVQSHKGRVDLKEKHRGWLVEMDYHDPANDERNQWFKSAKYDMGTFIKWPQLDDTSFTKNPNNTSQLDFVKTDFNNLVNKMSEGGFPTNGYRDMIDLESWAKYVLIQLFMDNFDFNSKAQTGFLLGSNYCYRIDSSRTSRIKAGPLWDFDLAAGLARTAPMGGGGGGWGMPGMGGGGQSSFPAHYQTYQDSIAPTHAFYRRLWDDPAFKAKYYKTWLKHKNDFQAMSQLIDQIKSQVEGSVQGKGANKWANNQMMGSANLTTQQFNTEVQNLKTWWNNRLNWVDQRLRSYNIDTTKDVIQSAPPGPGGSTSIASNQAKYGKGLSVVKNGLKINATSSASIKVFSLTGDIVRRQTLASGSHTVSLGNLPRGMYLVRVNLDGVKQNVKMAVR